VAIIYRIGVKFRTRAKTTPYKATKKRGGVEPKSSKTFESH
jgi:hypothetical protein